ncbi:YdeI/OmpD-associated family protein [Chryseobacterium sp. PTM-20240506]|uniref:YdeI/OmpD-associated family protein n=1 Tax=unclassified Chryseobacterium TaxID=2593645 RepID=UPI002358373C|nr:MULTISPECIES: YdeI/OmpD-associated family protein [unclassified Chryseobacterium]MDC8106954.1 YdeI/OmpD-associated family protein [Chryseobacterium sp. B21-037]MDQ1805766.1 YdeI/OmpD-associated family protein [Chryseobacterium sp. CKR4-1]WBV56155.1 YdeI/OmpD-associated family protein [Chryseobacterium daecheongense]
MEIQFFSTPQDFREWLEKNHETKTELLVGFYKIGTKKPSMTWSESVDQALCYGWIDGVRKSVDDEKYTIRFTPRKPTSIWSAINIKKVEDLTQAGLMKTAGLKAFALRKQEKTAIYSHENALAELSPAFEKQFKSNKKAWDFFSNQAPSYKKVMLHWIMSAKQEKTMISRLEKTIRESEQQKRVL